MAIRSFPYMSIKEDNKITASNEAERIDQIVDSGIVFDVLTSFECSNGTGPLDVKIAEGSAIIKGHAVISDAEEIKTVSEKDTNPRIDLIVLESNTNTNVRAASIKVIKGTPDLEENLTEPSLSGETGVSQIKLAKVFVPASGTNEYVTITDSRAACAGKHTHKRDQIIGITDCFVDNMFKNGFINGDFQVWQDGASIEPSSENKWYTADMWKCKRTDGVGGLTAFQTNDIDISETAKHTLRVHRNNGDTSFNAINIAYNFSTEESIKYRNKKITVSFTTLIGGAAAGDFTAYIYGGTGTDEDILNGYTGQITLASLIFNPTSSFNTFTFNTPNVVDKTITE